MPDLSMFEYVNSPFAELHFAEQKQFTSLYVAKHGASLNVALINGADPNKLRNEPLPPLSDESGHPLWFADLNCRDLMLLTQNLFATDRFDELERLFDELDDDRRIKANGHLWVEDYVPIAGRDWEGLRQHLELWHARYPRSPAQAMAEVGYWIEYAWDARGEGYSSTVTDTGWQLFNERLLKAQEHLEKSKSFADQTLVWTELNLRVGSFLWPKDKLLAVYLTSNEKSMFDLEAVEAVALMMLPKWGGSWRDFDDFARKAQQRSQAKEGHGFYARLYSLASRRSENPNIFETTDVDWQEMQHGYHDIIERFPHSAALINRFANFACMANDKATYIDLKRRLGVAVFPQQWVGGYSPDLCDHKFKLEPVPH